jgi:hypothetical protein
MVKRMRLNITVYDVDSLRFGLVCSLFLCIGGTGVCSVGKSLRYSVRWRIFHSIACPVTEVCGSARVSSGQDNRYRVYVNDVEN